MKIAYRVDDVSDYMNEDNFNKIEAIFNKYEIKPLIGVIPNNQDTKLMKYGKVSFNFWDRVKELQDKGWSIAVHGYNHKYVTKKSGILKYPKKSEFAGLDINLQFDKIKKAVAIFSVKSINANIFMAPSHSFDLNTLKVLEEHGFIWITDGLNFFKYKINNSNLEFIPQISSRIIKTYFGIQTVCLHINQWTEIDFINLEKEIVKNKRFICNYNELLTSKPFRFNFIFNVIEKILLFFKNLS